ncbi:MAG: MBL fold metallo-hydrolase [Planctomycetota bacterium]
MDVLSLQSGSSGNCILVRAAGTCVVIDAGISATKAANRMAAVGFDPQEIDALLITHDHSDHVSSLGPIHRRWDLPVHITEKTLRTVRRKRRPGQLEKLEFFRAGQTFTVGDFDIESIPTPHDASDGVCFVLQDRTNGLRVGILTDLGHVFPQLREVLPTLDAVLIESNYDDAMLREGPYPYSIRMRIEGRGGHLSNWDAARLIESSAGPNLQWVCLGHLSDQNNCPEVARKTFDRVTRGRFKTHLAKRDGHGQWMSVWPAEATKPRGPCNAAKVGKRTPMLF